MPKKRGDKKGQPDKAGKKADAGKGPVPNQSAVALAEHDQDDGAGEVAATITMSSFEGESSPDALVRQFEEKCAAWRAAFEEASASELKQMAAVQAVLAKVTQLEATLAEMEQITLVMQAKADDVNSAYDTVDESEIGPLGDLQVGYEDALAAALQEWSTAKSDTSGFAKKVGLTQAQVQKAEEDAKKKQAAADVAALERLKVVGPYLAQWAPGEAFDHFGRHKADTGWTTELEYYQAAAALNAKKPGGSIVRAKRSDGDTLTMDTSTGEFTIRRPDKIIRTYFCPGNVQDYFERQLEK